MAKVNSGGFVESVSQVLKWEFQQRVLKNDTYSLRAFSRDLRLNPSQVSTVMNGKKGLSKLKANHVASCLGYSSEKTEWFCDLAEAEFGRSAASREAAKRRLAIFNNGQLFENVQEGSLRFLHFLVRRLACLQDFKSDPRWISEALGVPAQEVERAIDRLHHLGLIKNHPEKGFVIEENVHLREEVATQENINNYKRDLDQLLGDIAQRGRNKFGQTRIQLFTIHSSQKEELENLLHEFEARLAELENRATTKEEMICLRIQMGSDRKSVV